MVTVSTKADHKVSLFPSMRYLTFRATVPESPKLLENEFHVWWINLAVTEDDKREFAGILSGEERKRAGQFRDPIGRDRYVVAHAAMRKILGRYLATEPASIDFVQDKHGKPHLAGSSQQGLCWSLSRSSERAILGIARGREIGIDLERLQPLDEVEGIIKTYFSDHEFDVLQELPLQKRWKRFYEFWTCKEAYVKARGLGLSFPFDQFDVVLDDNGFGTVSSSDKSVASLNWTIQRLETREEYAAAIAYQAYKIEKS